MAPELVSHEGETGKELVFGHDVSARRKNGLGRRADDTRIQLNFRPVLYMVRRTVVTATLSWLTPLRS